MTWNNDLEQNTRYEYEGYTGSSQYYEQPRTQQQQTYYQSMQGPRPAYDQPPFMVTPPYSDGRLAATLCYSPGWLTGLLFLLFGAQKPFVRFHALQSLIFFGVINLIDIGLLRIMFISHYYLGHYQWIWIFFLSGPVCMCWSAIRLRRFEGGWWRRILTEMCIIVGLGFVLNVAGQAFTIALFHATIIWSSRYDIALLLTVAPIVDYGVFFVCRVAMRVWLFWDQLRRTQLIWGLTHAHVMVLALGAGLLISLVDIYLVSRSNDLISVPTMILPATVLMVVVSVCALIAVIPPFALFSHIAMRHTVFRLKLLTAATSALRGGNYGVRVPIVGEDEVAQLQSDFNAMATELQRAMRELQGERDTVAKLLQERRELIANVSHELRTPVATLRGYLETTLMHWDEISRTKLYHDLRVMEDETVRLQGLVEDLFILSRAEVGKLALHCVPTAIDPLIHHVVDATAPLVWRSSKIELVANVPAGLPLVIVDVKRMEQILQNLLHNGVRHTAPGGIVAVMVMTEADNIIAIQVRDTGEGIAADDLPHIWQRFYQAESSRMGGGTGLGLALVKEWVETMGGTVAVESVLGEGSCFTIRLPAATASTITTQSLLPHTSLPSLNS